jgi:hypothetical protein
VRLLSKLFSALAILSPLPSFAELPKGNSFISVGTFNQGTNLEASYYIDKTSIQKKEISFITLNGSCRNTNSQIILILVNANTSTQKLKKWLIAKIGKEGQFTFQL